MSGKKTNRLPYDRNPLSQREEMNASSIQQNERTPRQKKQRVRQNLVINRLSLSSGLNPKPLNHNLLVEIIPQCYEHAEEINAGSIKAYKKPKIQIIDNLQLQRIHPPQQLSEYFLQTDKIYKIELDQTMLKKLNRHLDKELRKKAQPNREGKKTYAILSELANHSTLLNVDSRILRFLNEVEVGFYT